ncbi:MAG: HD domain-containing protein, partial [Sphaerochaeta sp.]|nr:HD domain-containing protein [Sphaerochaeta sp.]
IGFNLLSSVNQYAPLAEQVLCHHERWDGTGYPNQIAGETIPLYSRILALCDSFDAMTNMRPYKSVITVDEALDEIQRCSSRQFDPNLAGRFIEMIREES